MGKRNLILTSLIIGLSIGLLGSIYDPFGVVFARPENEGYQPSERHTIEIMDRELKHVNDRFDSIQNQLGVIYRKMDSICDDITNVRIKAAESGSIYGGGAGVLAYLIGMLVSGFRKKNGNGEKAALKAALKIKEDTVEQLMHGKGEE